MTDATPLGTGSHTLLLPRLAGFYARGRTVSYVLLRICFALTIVTHSLPKLLDRPPGSMTDPFGGSAILIGNVLGLPFLRPSSRLLSRCWRRSAGSPLRSALRRGFRAHGGDPNGGNLRCARVDVSVD